MTQPAAASADTRPPIRIVDFEAEVMSDLALVRAERAPDVTRLLLEEIERAEIVGAAALPPDTVRLGSQVEFVNETTGRSHSVTLVLPFEADIAAGAVSILTPVGAGLVGLSAGQRIGWPDARGVEQSLRVVSVQPPNRT